MSGGPTPLDRFGGAMMVAALLAAVPHELTGSAVFQWASGLFTLAGLCAFAPRVRWSRQVFVAIGLALLAISAATQDDWRDTAMRALASASFIAAFFTALTAIRSAAMGNPGIVDCGRFLAGQPPGRRYLALTLGGHLFGLVLIYGSISLLSALATETTRGDADADAELRRHRTRRMLVAIQRGFVSTLPWSPLAFASAISLTVVPEARWAAAVPLCLVSAALLAGIGWALDTAFKPRLSRPAPARGPAEGQWLRHLRPLFVLLGVLSVSVAVLHVATGIRIFGVVMGLVPLIALALVAVEPAAAGRRLAHTARRAKTFATDEMPRLEGELVLLVMAGFIGTLGAHLAVPLAESRGLDLSAVPTPLLLVAVFWSIPLLGQVGLNPILAVSLFAPLLPTPEAMGVSPAVVVCAITSGWALSGATSPFTASVLLIGAYGGVSAPHVGLRWNGAYALATGAALSLWIAALALWDGGGAVG